MASWNVPSCSMYLLAHVLSLSASEESLALFFP